MMCWFSKFEILNFILVSCKKKRKKKKSLLVNHHQPNGLDCQLMVFVETVPSLCMAI